MPSIFIRNDAASPETSNENLGPVLLIMTSILLSLSILTTVMRIWARGMHRSLGWDDITIVICCCLAIGRSIIQFVSVSHGNGQHRHNISAENYRYVNFLTWMTQIFLFLNIGLLKCSICILILRIKNIKILRYCLYTMMAGLVLTNFECIFILLAECSPVEKYWNPAVKGKCWNTAVRIYSIYVQVAYSVITDLCCALLPIVVLWNVKIARSLKFAVCGLMSMGLAATAAALVRASSLGTKTNDLSYDYCIAAIWGNLELHLGIIATNLSLSRSIYGYFSGQVRSIVSGSSHQLSHSRNRMRTRTDRESVNSSQIELGTHVLKTTEFQIVEERLGSRGDDEMHVPQVTHEIWNATPTIEKGFPRRLGSKLSRDRLRDSKD